MDEDGLCQTADLKYVNTLSNSTWMASDVEYTADKSTVEQVNCNSPTPPIPPIPPTPPLSPMSPMSPNPSDPCLISPLPSDCPNKNSKILSVNIPAADAADTPASNSKTNTAASTPIQIVRTQTPSTGMNLGREASVNDVTYISGGNMHDDESNGSVLVNYINKLNDAVDEVVKLLRGDSLRRFYDSDEYQRLIEEIKVYQI